MHVMRAENAIRNIQGGAELQIRFLITAECSQNSGQFTTYFERSRMVRIYRTGMLQACPGEFLGCRVQSSPAEAPNRSVGCGERVVCDDTVIAQPWQLRHDMGIQCLPGRPILLLNGTHLLGHQRKNESGCPADDNIGLWIICEVRQISFSDQSVDEHRRHAAAVRAGGRRLPWAYQAHFDQAVKGDLNGTRPLADEKSAGSQGDLIDQAERDRSRLRVTR